MDRYFNDPSRTAAYLAADGCCVDCGAELAGDWHADHDWAHSAGGPSVTANAAARCPSCNLAKGDGGDQRLRDWQRRFLASFEGDGAPWAYLAVACPGAGKTTAASVAIRRGGLTGTARRTVVVVPSEALKRQWADAAARHGVTLEPYWGSGQCAWPKGHRGPVDGIVVTYAQATNVPALLARHLAGYPSLLIADECHHISTDRRWGTAMAEIGRAADRVLLLSGTPFRSDNTEIPFVTYDADGRASAQFSYGYRAALDDGIVRPVEFFLRGGTADWMDPAGTVCHADFADAVDDTSRARRLRTALVEGDFMRETLQAADRRLSEIRSRFPDAGGLIVAADTHHARSVASQLAEITGTRPDVVVADEADAKDRITHFDRDASRRWLVAVRMVSEGVDIPRLRVGVYATTWTTRMFFRQFVGRFVRVQAAAAACTSWATDHDDGMSSIFIPDDPVIRELAREVTVDVVHHIDRDTADTDARDGADVADAGPVAAFTPLGSTGTATGAVFDGNVFDADLTARAQQLLATNPKLPGSGMTATQVALVLDCTRTVPVEAVGDRIGGAQPAWRAKEQLRAANEKAVRRLVARRHDLDYAEVQRALNAEVGIRSVTDASVSELSERLGCIRAWAASTGSATSGDGTGDGDDDPPRLFATAR